MVSKRTVVARYRTFSSSRRTQGLYPASFGRLSSRSKVAATATQAPFESRRRGDQ